MKYSGVLITEFQCCQFLRKINEKKNVRSGLIFHSYLINISELLKDNLKPGMKALDVGSGKSIL